MNPKDPLEWLESLKNQGFRVSLKLTPDINTWHLAIRRPGFNDPEFQCRTDKIADAVSAAFAALNDLPKPAAPIAVLLPIGVKGPSCGMTPLAKDYAILRATNKKDREAFECHICKGWHTRSTERKPPVAEPAPTGCVTGKRGFASNDEAEAAAVSMTKSNLRRPRLGGRSGCRAYLCDVCTQWHITSAPWHPVLADRGAPP